MVKTSRQGWSGLQRQEGIEFLQCLRDSQVLQAEFGILAEGLYELLSDRVRTQDDACKVWAAVSAVTDKCDKESTYSLPGAEWAYSWLYLLDRYVRSWRALQLLVEHCQLPMGREGVRVLDIGTGPGPSAFATHDFYVAMAAYAKASGNELWRQPVQVTCIEFACSMNGGISICSGSMTSPARSYRTTPVRCPPKLPVGSSRRIGNRQPAEKNSAPKGYEKAYGTLRTLVGLRPDLRRTAQMEASDLQLVVLQSIQASYTGLNAHRCQKSHNAIGVRNDLRSGLRWPERSNCLRYIHQVELRQAIEKQLNRIELANSFTRAVALGNPRGLEHAGKSEQEIAKSCNRLIKNRTICWNYLYLTCQIEAPRTPEEQDRLQRMISPFGPVMGAFQHARGVRLL